MTAHERFRKKWQPDSKGCWIWVGAMSTHGYGFFRFGGKKMQAHRASWLLFRGLIPPDLCVLHDCDVKRCINPDHLHTGTVQDNAQEAIARGFWPNHKGENNGNAKLTRTQVIAIRNSRESYRQISLRFGVKKSQIGNIKKGTRWKHLQ